jgi:hypothetical protein
MVGFFFFLKWLIWRVFCGWLTLINEIHCQFVRNILFGFYLTAINVVRALPVCEGIEPFTPEAIAIRL